MTRRRDEPIATRLQQQVAALRASGMSATAIAEAIKTSRKTVWRYAAGLAQEPQYRNAVRLEALYAKRLGDRSR
jgi:DNA-binding NarL/FixJ family response regulator